jgi:hypothetical protein
MTNHLILILILISFCGCSQSKNKPLWEVLPPKPAKTYAASKPVLIEINSVPHPFDVAGNFPYVLWINGMHVPNPDHKALFAIVNKLGEDRIPTINYEDIHEGWTEPRFVRKYFQEEKEGRSRVLNITQ